MKYSKGTRLMCYNKNGIWKVQNIFRSSGTYMIVSEEFKGIFSLVHFHIIDSQYYIAK